MRVRWHTACKNASRALNRTDAVSGHGDAGNSSYGPQQRTGRRLTVHCPHRCTYEPTGTWYRGTFDWCVVCIGSCALPPAARRR
jgi:hypothetical protein